MELQICQRQAVDSGTTRRSNDTELTKEARVTHLPTVCYSTGTGDVALQTNYQRVLSERTLGWDSEKGRTVVGIALGCLTRFGIWPSTAPPSMPCRKALNTVQ